MLLSKSVLDKVKSIVLLADESGDVQYVSPFFLEIVGVDPVSFELLPDGEKRKLAQKVLGRLMLKVQLYIDRKSSEEIQFIHGFKNLKGIQKWIQCALSLTDQNELLLTGSDITQQKMTELSLRKRHNELLFQNKEHVESLTYAKRLQKAILPDLTGSVTYAKSSMVFFRPKEAVSGDFYWTGENENGNYIAAIDCTGHGIPGAMLTVMANTMLREVILNRKVKSPAEILKALDTMLEQSFAKGNGKIGANDGFDISLVRVQQNKVTYAGAFRPLVLVSNNKVKEVQGDRFPIGFFFNMEKNFSEYTFTPKSGDRIYLFSDGYTDQFGGERNKKFTKRKFKELLLSMDDLTMEEQSGFLSYSFSNWKQKNEQTDDVLVIGVEF